MRRTIGAIGAMLAIAAVLAITAAPASASGSGISGDGIEQDDMVSASLTSQPGGDLFGVQFSDYDRDIECDVFALDLYCTGQDTTGERKAAVFAPAAPMARAT